MEGWDPINWLNPGTSHDLDFPMSYAMVFFMSIDLRQEVVGHFVDIGGIYC